MLKARRNRYNVHFAELMLTALLGVNGAYAQTPGATPASPAAPTAAAPTAAAPTAAAPTAAAPTAAAPTAAALPAPRPQPLLPSSEPEGHRADLASTMAEPETPEEIMRDEPLRKPPGSARWLLLGTGVGVTGLFYAGAWGIREAWPSQADRPDLKIPVAGPFMELAHTGCPASNTNCSTFQLVVRTILVSLDAIGQAGGIALMLESAVMSTASVEAPRSTPSATLRRPRLSPNIIPVPWLDGNNGGGIGITGRF